MFLFPIVGKPGNIFVGNAGLHEFCAGLIGTRKIHVSRAGNMWTNVNNLFGNIFASWEAKSRFGNNVSPGAWDIMFSQQCSAPGLPRALQL